jgi:formylglycine-generating enzyme required for sulfatase activity
LPTEAEWEKACRAGSTGKYCFGNNQSKLGDYAWYYWNVKGRNTRPVGQKKPNAWGIYDMHGNVVEWCADWYDDNYYKNSPYKNPKGPDSRERHVARGGAWGYGYTDFFTSANRDWAGFGSNGGDNDVGFRCVCNGTNYWDD